MMTDKPSPKSKATKNVELDKLKKQVEQLTAALQHERADAINLRRRHEAEVLGLKNRIKASVVKDLLPVIDNFDRALDHIPKDIVDTPFVKGIEGIVKQFNKALEDIGVTKIKTIGEEFDPRYHSAVSMEEGEGSKEVVSQELQSGYKLNDEVIRHAFVKVKLQ